MPIRSTLQLVLLGLVLSGLSCGAFLPGVGNDDETFVVQGTFELRSDLFGFTCPVWVDNSGVTYHLFQSPELSNEDFDAVTVEGITSRLQVRTRSDLTVGCLQGVIVEVIDVL